MYSNSSTCILFATNELGKSVSQYSEDYSSPLPRDVSECHASVTKGRQDAYMLTESHQMQFYVFLSKILGTKRVLEIGGYVGFSALAWAHAVGPGGSVTSLEFSDEFSEEARSRLKASNIQNVNLVVGDATKTLPDLHPSEPFDLVLIDADKGNYPVYLEQLLSRSRPDEEQRLLKKDAIILVDNVLRWGHVPCESLKTEYWPTEEDKKKELDGLRKANELCRSDDRLEMVMLPLWDGLSLVRLID